jgi:hypothetical protein
MPRIENYPPEGQDALLEPSTLDHRVRLILAAIEGERVPERLLELATALQKALAEQKQKRTPN